MGAGRKIALSSRYRAGFSSRGLQSILESVLFMLGVRWKWVGWSWRLLNCRNLLDILDCPLAAVKREPWPTNPGTNLQCHCGPKGKLGTLDANRG